MPHTKGGGRSTPVPPKAAPDGVTLGERWALARIVATSDLIQLPDGSEYLLIPAPADLLDTLAAFDAEAEDIEDEGVALDWTHGRGVQINGRWRWPVVVQDGEQEPAY